MKNYIKLLILIFAFNFQTGYAQFFGKGGKVITECNCNKRLDELNATINLPSSINEYDIIIFTVKDNKNNILNLRKYQISSIRGKTSMNFNLLNPNQKGVQLIIVPGLEKGLFEGNDFSVNYNVLCETTSSERDIHIEIIGVKQVGTETEYSYDQAKDVVRGKTRALYDNGTVIQASESLKIIPKAKVSYKIHLVLSTVAQGLSIVTAGVVYAVMSKPFKDAQ